MNLNLVIYLIVIHFIQYQQQTHFRKWLINSQTVYFIFKLAFGLTFDISYGVDRQYKYFTVDLSFVCI